MLNWITDSPKPVFKGVKSNDGSKNAGKSIAGIVSSKEDSLLIAYGLTAEMEKQFSVHDNKISAFWNMIDDSKDYIRMTAKKNGAADANFNPVLTHDCNMNVKAAYGADGMYFLFVINDDNDVAWPNKFNGTQNEQFYLDFDAVDVIMDSRSIADICKPENHDMMLSKDFGLTSTTKQYQIACGAPKERPLGFRRSIPEPWNSMQLS